VHKKKSWTKKNMAEDKDRTDKIIRKRRIFRKYEGEKIRQMEKEEHKERKDLVQNQVFRKFCQ
jgi:hypothetical protein